MIWRRAEWHVSLNPRKNTRKIESIFLHFRQDHPQNMHSTCPADGFKEEITLQARRRNESLSAQEKSIPKISTPKSRWGVTQIGYAITVLEDGKRESARRENRGMCAQRTKFHKDNPEALLANKLKEGERGPQWKHKSTADPFLTSRLRCSSQPISRCSCFFWALRPLSEPQIRHKSFGGDKTSSFCTHREQARTWNTLQEMNSDDNHPASQEDEVEIDLEVLDRGSRTFRRISSTPLSWNIEGAAVEDNIRKIIEYARHYHTTRALPQAPVKVAFLRMNTQRL